MNEVTKEATVQVRQLNHYFGTRDNRNQVLYDVDLDAVCAARADGVEQDREVATLDADHVRPDGTQEEVRAEAGVDRDLVEVGVEGCHPSGLRIRSSTAVIIGACIFSFSLYALAYETFMDPLERELIARHDPELAELLREVAG